MTDAFVKGFIKAARAEGCTTGEALDIFKWAVSTGAFQTPSFSPPKPVNPNPPIVDTMAPSKMFPMPGNNPGASGGLGGTGGLGASGGLGSLGSGQQQPAASNFGFNINQTGLGGVNNSVSSAPSSPVNSVLNKPTAAPAMAPTM